MMDDVNNNDVDRMDDEDVMLPGFRFHPTDEELVGFYLKRKILQRPLSIELIKQLDIYKYDPWDLPKLAATGEKEWYFYCPRDRKYRNSARPNRVTGAGFWKATGTDRPIYSSEGSKCIGLKKSLVFYRGRAAKGVKTEWMMHEFRLPSLLRSSSPKGSFSDKAIPAHDSWAICRIFRKTSSTAQRSLPRSYISPSTLLTENSASQNTQPDTTKLNAHLTCCTPENMSRDTNSTSPPTMHNYTNLNYIDMRHSTITSSSDFSSLQDTNQTSQKPNGLKPDDFLNNGDFIDNVNLLFPTHESPGLTKCIADFSSNILLNASSHSSVTEHSTKTNQGMLYNHFDGELQPDIDQQTPKFSVVASPGGLTTGNVSTTCESENTVLDSRWAKNTLYIADQYEPVWLGGFPYGLGANINDGAWKSNLVWDTSSCPNDLLSTYYNYDHCSTANCYT